MADDEGSDEERTDEDGAEPPVRDDPDAGDGSSPAGADGDDGPADDPEDDSDEREDADEGTGDDEREDVDDPYGFNSYDPFSLDDSDADDSDADDGERDRPHAVSNFERRRAEREAGESSADGEEADGSGEGDDDAGEGGDDTGEGGEGDDGDDGDADDGTMYHDPEFDLEYADAGATESIVRPGDDGGDDDGGNGGVLDAPEGDEELPLAVHIEEMVRRLFVVLAVVGLVTLFVFPVADQLINYLWNYHIPGAPELADRRPRLYGPLELILTEIKVASLAGVVIGLPVFVYETYRFMRPGLYPRERRYYLASVPTSLVLALVGLAFAHFVVLPAIFAYFTAYTTGTAVVAFGLQETFRLILLLMGYMAVVFQIPLFIMLAIMMNLVTRQGLESRRLLFWGAFLGISFFVSPDPTGMAPIIIAATMVVLFEGTLLLLRWTGN